MAYSIARIKVRDFGVWMPQMEGFAEMRQGMGSRGSKVFQSADDPNDLVVVQEWDTLDNARKFGTSPALAAAMKNAGVLGEPEFVYTESVHEVEY